jgi:hypothetical protein
LARDAVGAGDAVLESHDLLGHRGGELFAPPGPRKRLVIEQQQRPGRVRLQATVWDLRLDVDHDLLVAEPHAEILQAPVPASGLRQHVVELISEHRSGVTARRPHARFAAPCAMIVVEHPPVHGRVAQLQDA